MKTEMRRRLAQLSFEEKIRKVSELIRLSRNVKSQRMRCSLKGAKPMKVFMPERKDEWEVKS